MTKHSFGWRPDTPDQRDLIAPVPLALQAMHLPPAVDLRPECPPVYDQGQLGSCTANAIGAAVEFSLMKSGKPPATPSRLFIYYNERVMENTIASDAGASLRDGIKSVNKIGVCLEREWPYKIAAFSRRPSPKCYENALTCRVSVYHSVPRTLVSMKSCLASGFPFVFGFTVYESFESDSVASSGVVPMPAPNEQTLGGHAVLAVGYDDAEQAFIVRNSWGSGWGLSGYFKMPMKYLLSPSLASDFWTVRT